MDGSPARSPFRDAAARLHRDERGNESIEHLLILGFMIIPTLFLPGLMIRVMREYFLYESVVFTSPLF